MNYVSIDQESCTRCHPVHSTLLFTNYYTLSLNELFGIRNKDIRSVSIISDVINICCVYLWGGGQGAGTSRLRGCIWGPTFSINPK